MAMAATATSPFGDVMRQRNALSVKAPVKPTVETSIGAATKGAPMYVAKTVNEQNFEEIERLGELKLKVEEDFSLLTTGSEDEPDMMTDLTVDPFELFGNAWWSFNSKYTHTPNWGVNDSYPAGGCLYMYGEQTQVHLNTPLIKLDEYSGIGVLEFRARTRIPGAVFNELYVEAAETRGMGPTWDFLGTAMVGGINNDWKTYRILFTNCGPTTMFNIVTMNATLLFIDDVKVYEVVAHVAAPVVKPHTDYRGTSFTANWASVADADHYLLSVYSINAANFPVYVVKDQKVEGTSYAVDGVNSGETYYYTVKAVKGEHISIESDEQRVYDLEVPVLKPSEVTGEYDYRASWNPVPHADVYNYWAYDKRVAAEAGEFVVTNENFNGVLDADGYPTGWVKNDPDDEGYSYDLFYPMEMHQLGWRGTHCAPFTDYIAVDAWWYEWVGEDAGFLSPELDLSKDGGRFKVSVDLAGNTCQWPVVDENGDWVVDQFGNYVYEPRVTQACVALFNWDDELGDYRQAELLYPKSNVQEDWTRFEFNFTKGTERSVVGIYAIRGLDWLFIDNLKLTQNYQKDDYLLEPFCLKRFHGSRDGEDATQIDVTVPPYASGMEIYHKVSAFGRKVTQQGGYSESYDDRESAYSDLEYVRTTVKSGIDSIKLDENLNGELRFYNMQGVRVDKPEATGVYVKVQGTKADKVIVK